MRRALLTGVLVIGCTKDAPPDGPPTPEAAAEVAPQPSTAAPKGLLDRYPSVRHYPELHEDLEPGLQTRDTEMILRGLARTFRPHKPEYEHWDRTGHIRLTGDVTGFVSETSDGLIPQPPPTYNLSCAGGFLEGVRLLLLPNVELDELGTCEGECSAGDFGLRVLRNIAARLSPKQLPNGPELHTTRVEGPDTVPATVPADQVKLCTVSHVSPAAGGERMHHHMMMLVPPSEGDVRLRIFDTTGSRGVSLRPRTRQKLRNYVRLLLADNDAYHYDPKSTDLTCFDARP